MHHAVGTHRLNVARISEQLDRIRKKGLPPPGKRHSIESPKAPKRAPVPSLSAEHLVRLYGVARIESVARVMVVLEMLREHEHLDARQRKIEPSAHRAIWQAYSGTLETHACHTCPTHLQLDGQMPTMATSNRGLQRHIINEFASCFLIDKSVNHVDRLVDVAAGKHAFVKAADAVLNQRGTTALEGLAVFKESYGELFGADRALSFEYSGGIFEADDPKTSTILDVIAGFYEGIFLTPIDTRAVELFRRQVDNEIGLTDIAAPTES